MADDLNPAKRAEIVAAIAVVKPQIRGLGDIVAASISPPLQALVRTQSGVRVRRHTLLQAVIDSMDAAVAALTELENDGYPGMPAAPLPGPLWTELQAENNDVERAVAIFTTEQLTADLANSSHDFQAIPPKG